MTRTRRCAVIVIRTKKKNTALGTSNKGLHGSSNYAILAAKPACLFGTRKKVMPIRKTASISSQRNYIVNGMNALPSSSNHRAVHKQVAYYFAVGPSSGYHSWHTMPDFPLRVLAAFDSAQWPGNTTCASCVWVRTFSPA